MVVNVVVIWSIFACCSTLFSKPPTYIYTVKMTESDHKKAYQEYLKEKTFRTVVIYFAIKICFYQICGRYIRCYVLPVISDAWVHAYINVQHICAPIKRKG
jgi:Na+/melibiose symporter-like transporter